MELTVVVTARTVKVVIGNSTMKVKKEKYNHATITINGEYLGILKKGVLRLVFVKAVGVCKDNIGNVDVYVYKV